MATKAVVAFGPSDVYCSLGLWGAKGVMVYGKTNLPKGVFWMGTSSAVKSKGLLG